MEELDQCLNDLIKFAETDKPPTAKRRRANAPRGPAWLSSESTRAKRPGPDFDASLVDTICAHANADGLSPHHLDTVARILVSQQIDEQSAGRLVKALLPQDQVPGDIVCALLGPFGQQSHALQAMILKWLVMVYDLLDTRATLRKCFAVLFHYLDYDILRPYLCHLLCRLTRRGDVRPFRVRRLQALNKKLGSQGDPYVSALLQVFSDFTEGDHSLIASTSYQKRAHVFKVPDQTWYREIQRVRAEFLGESSPEEEKRQDEADMFTGPSQRHPTAGATTTTGTGGGKAAEAAKRRQLVIPSLDSHSENLDPTRSVSARAISFKDVSTVRELCHALKHLELPNQLSSVLDSRALQHVISLHGGHSELARISNWVEFKLEEEHLWRDGRITSSDAPTRLTRLLRYVASFNDFLQACPPVVEAFLIEYLRTWNGVSNQDEIFFLLSTLRPRSFESLFVDILTPLNRLISISSPNFVCKTLTLFTNLLRAWCSLDWKTFEAELTPDDRRTDMGRYLFEGISTSVNYYRTIYEFIKHVDQVCALALYSSGDNFLIQHGVLSFFEVAISLHTAYQMPFIAPPSSVIIYRCLYSSNAMAVSRMGGLLATYKNEKTVLAENASNIELGFPIGTEDEVIGEFQISVYDYADSLWMGQAFENRHEQTRLDLDQAIREGVQAEDAVIAQSLSITHSLPYLAYAHDFLTEHHPDHTFEDLANRKQFALRLGYLYYLRERGHVGTYEFVFNLIRRYVKLRASGAERTWPEPQV